MQTIHADIQQAVQNGAASSTLLAGTYRGFSQFADTQMQPLTARKGQLAELLHQHRVISNEEDNYT